ncbi:MAG: DUF4417 domain-containing protein [Petrimonas sp.]|nr:DUF4417 domain-containing protein [Petrimonas sp.]
MTEENYNYRTSQTLLRNQFPGKGKLQIPIIPKFQVKQGDFDDLMLIGFDKTHPEDQNHLNRMVHFFLYDYRFERVWKTPDSDLEKLSRYRAVLSPDFSMYLEMAPIMQLYNVFRNRWCGAYWASKGMRVIPTVNWGDESTFDFCFEGIEKGGIVAVSTYMATEHDNRKAQKEWFMAGYNEMLRRIEPKKIICYNTPFPEMQGDIVFVDYERSSWKYMSYERGVQKEDLDAYRIGDIHSKTYDTIEPYLLNSFSFKGGGSAYGGKWKPSSDKDNRLSGTPGEIKTTFNKNGEKTETLIGSDGKASKEIHYSSHGNSSIHDNPHGHIITYDAVTGYPDWGNPINGVGTDFLKHFIGGKLMSTIIYDTSTPEYNRFKTISDFKWSMKHGAEIEFNWDGVKYGISHATGKITIYRWNQPDTTRQFDTPDDALEYMVGSDRLRDVITQVTVIDRTI